MDYKKIHDTIIKHAKNRINNGYVEKHHIIPKCLGGTNKKDNLVKLTAKEHFLIHKLLTFIYPDNNSLIYAYWAMCGLLSEKRYIPSARIYEYSKKKMSEITKERLKDFNVWKGKKHSEESKLKQSASAKKRNISLENEIIRRQGISNKMKLLKRTPEWNNNVSEAKKGDKNPMFGKTGRENKRSIPILQFDLDDNFIKEWDNANIASQELSINYKAINACIRGLTKTSGGFKWKTK